MVLAALAEGAVRAGTSKLGSAALRPISLTGFGDALSRRRLVTGPCIDISTAAPTARAAFRITTPIHQSVASVRSFATSVPCSSSQQDQSRIARHTTTQDSSLHRRNHPPIQLLVRGLSTRNDSSNQRPVDTTSSPADPERTEDKVSLFHGTSTQNSSLQSSGEESVPPDSSSYTSDRAQRDSSSASQSTKPSPESSTSASAGSSKLSFDGLTSSASLSSLISTASSRVSDLTQDLRTKLSNLSSQWNTYSGYAEIEALKVRITELEALLDEARSALSLSKKHYLTSVASRSAAQKEINDLLSRKPSWSDSDLSRYTELLRQEHQLSRSESTAEKDLERAEKQVQDTFDNLMRAVMVRYHEEQIWSDRIRGLSTYGSLIVAGLNALLFILAILLVEPYKRKKLAQTFETRLLKGEEQSRELILATISQFENKLENVTTNILANPAAAPVLLENANTQAEKDNANTKINNAPQDTTTLSTALLMTQEEERKRSEERLVFASTAGVVVGAALSMFVGMCWGS